MESDKILGSSTKKK